MADKILCLDGFAGPGLEQLQKSGRFELISSAALPTEQLREKIPPFAGLIVRSATQVTSEVIQAADKLKIIARAGIGTDNIDLAAATGRGIFVVNAPSGNTTSTAELTLAMLLSLSRHIPQAARKMAEGKWEKKRFKGSEVARKMLGVVGLGRIGKEVAKRAQAFKMLVAGYDPFLDRQQMEQLDIKPMKLEELFRSADYITFHTPLTAETENMVSAAEFAIMKPSVRLINCARGGIINEADLFQALHEGKIAGAALDVYRQEPLKENIFAELENCITTPHLGASTAEAQASVGLEIAEVLERFFQQGFTHNAVNLPGVSAEQIKQVRPLLKLAERLGRLAAQLNKSGLKQVTFGTAMRDTQLLTSAAVKGVIGELETESPSFVNARACAKARGIVIKEEILEPKKNAANLLEIKIDSEAGQVGLSACLAEDGRQKLVRYNDYRLEIELKEKMLFIENADQPGVLGKICNVLGEAQVNIAQMYNARFKKGAPALTVLCLDQVATAETLTAIGKLDTIQQVRQVAL